MNALAIAAGGALGSLLRYFLLLAGPAAGIAAPWVVCLINISGSFAIGYVSHFAQEKFADSEALRLFLMTGVLGGYTTFSAFSLDFFRFFQRGEIALALLYVLLSVALSLAGCVLGVAASRMHFA